jgi:hypothetical protein
MECGDDLLVARCVSTILAADGSRADRQVVLVAVHLLDFAVECPTDGPACLFGSIAGLLFEAA